jgi:hypothetical protein
VEPIEDPFLFAGGDSQPSIEDGQRSAVDDHVDRSATLVELAGVVDEVGDGPIECGAGRIDRRSVADLDDHVA